MEDAKETRAERRARKRDETLAKERRRMPKKWAIWLGAVVGLGALTWFAPGFAMRTSLRDWAIDRGVTASGLPAKVRVESVSLGWFSPIIVNGVVVEDEAGAQVAAVDRVHVDRHLIQLLADQSDLGTIRVERPVVRAILRRDGSNLEDLLAPILNSESKSSSRPKLTVEIVDGVVEATNPDGGLWGIDGCDALVNLRDDPNRVKAEAKGRAARLVSSGEGTKLDESVAPGEFAVAIDWPLAGPAAIDAASDSGSGALTAVSANGGSANEAHIGLTTDRIPTELFGPLAARFAGDVDFAGQLSSDCKVTMQGETQVIELNRCEWIGARLRMPAYLGADQPHLQKLVATGTVRRDPAGITAEKVTITSDVAALQAHGRIGLPNKSPTTTGSAPTSANVASTNAAATSGAAASVVDVSAEGEVDVARLAALLPNTLRLREGMQITSGKVVLKADSQQVNGEQRIVGHVQTSDLAGSVQGQQVVWRNPLVVDFDARTSQAGWSIDRVSAKADFCELEGRGTLEEGSLTANADLDRLMAELNRFVDWGSTRLAGALDANVQWRRESANGVSLDGRALIERLDLAAPGVRPWREDRLEATVQARAAIDANQLKRIDAGKATVLSGSDRLQVELTDVVALTSEVGPASSTASALMNAVWPVKAELSGELSRWLARVQLVAPLAGWNGAGKIKADLLAKAARDRVLIDSLDSEVNDLAIDGPNVFIREPLARVQFAGSWDSKALRLESRETIFQSTALSLRAGGVDLQFAGEQPRMQGSASFQGDLARLMNWFQDPRVAPTQTFSGTTTGSVQLTFADGVSRARWQTDVKEFAWLQPAGAVRTGGAATIGPAGASTSPKTLWQEPALSLRGDARINHTTNVIDADSIELGASSVKVRAAGRIEQPTTSALVNLTGEVDYDLPSLVQRFRGYLGPDIRLAGSGTRAFRLEGPLLQATPESTGAAGPNIATASSRTIPAGATPNGRNVTLVSRELRGDAALGWTSAYLFGLQLGPADVKAHLADAAVVAEPLELAVSEGTLKLAPRVELTSAPLMTLPQGELIDHVRFSPDLCRTWFKYVAPLLADATAAEGQFSVNLNGAAVPLSQPTNGEAAGTMLIHGARLGPGPLSRELLTAVQQVRSLIERKPLGSNVLGGDTWVSLPEQQVPVEWRDGFVRHDGLTMLVRDTAIKTRGEVGIDQTLNLVAEIPIRDEWLGKEQWTAGLRGQSVQVPIRGTVSAPRLDGRVIEQLGKQIARDAAGKFIGDQLKGLGDQLPGGLGGQLPFGLGGQPPAGQPPAGTSGQPPINLEDELQKGAEEQIQKGLQKLFGPRN